jgi:hypothetical protein
MSLSTLLVMDKAWLSRFIAVMGSRVGYVLTRLIVVLGLPYLLGAEALGKFGLFSALATVWPVLMGMGMPEHSVRRLGIGSNTPIFRVLVRQTFLSMVLGGGATYLYLTLYDGVSTGLCLMVALLVVVEVFHSNLHVLALGRGATVRANITFLLGTLGPVFCLLWGAFSPLNLVTLDWIVLSWLGSNALAALFLLPVVYPDFKVMRDNGAGYGSYTSRLKRHMRILYGLRHVYLMQIVNVLNTYIDRMLVPLLIDFRAAGIYNFFALAMSVAVMFPQAAIAQADLQRLVSLHKEQDMKGYTQTLKVGVMRSMALAALLMLPLLGLHSVAEVILKIDMPLETYFALSGLFLLSSVFAAGSVYLWNAIYIAREEHHTVFMNLLTPPFIIALFVMGATFLGLVGAAAAMLAINVFIFVTRLRVVRGFLR